jgi:hypothetical protein
MATEKVWAEMKQWFDVHISKRVNCDTLKIDLDCKARVFANDRSNAMHIVRAEMKSVYLSVRNEQIRRRSYSLHYNDLNEPYSESEIDPDIGDKQ